MTPFFLDTGAGACFAIHHTAGGAAPKAQVLYLHPFAEEMNKSRRMAALQARALAAQGVAVLQIDLQGCGDSPGELHSASWSGWRTQAVDAARWLTAQAPTAPLWLWGLRAGALLAAEAADALREDRRSTRPVGLLLWQPVVSGKLALRQFLRLRLAGELPAANGTAIMAAMKQQLQQGAAIEIAGYRLPAAVADGLEQAELPTPPVTQPVHWLEVSAAEPPELLPASSTLLSRWQAAGCQVRAQAVPGPAFWQTAEIEEAPALIDATLAALLLPQPALGRAA